MPHSSGRGRETMPSASRSSRSSGRTMRRTFRIIGVLAAVFVATSAGPSAQQPVVTPGGILPVLDTYLESLRQQVGIPGMSAAVLKDGVVVFEKGYGFANLATRERATPDTPYLAGDVTQTLAAVLLLQCVEQRRVDLDERFETYGLSSPEPGATLRSVLGHAAPDGFREPFLYNPQRFAQLTSLMEWCAPQPYRKSVAHRILNHLAMRDSVPGTDLQNPDLELPEGMFDDGDLERYRRVLAKLAVPYKVTGRSRTERTDLPPAAITAADGLVTTVRDLARFDV